MNIGCITLVRRNGKLLGIQCSKGRGWILPGGKLEPGETFIECARRELKEEAGLDGYNFKLIFQAPDGFGYHCLAFTADVYDFDLAGSGEEVVRPVTWEELKQSKYKAYYELLEQVCLSAQIGENV